MKKKCIIKPPAYNVGGTKLYRVMKLVSIFFLVFSLHLTASVTAQKKVVNLRIKNGTIVDVLNAIEQQTDFRFAYSSEFVNLDKKVSVDVHQEEIGKVLDEVLTGTNYLYRLQDNFIIFIPDDKESTKENQQEKEVQVSGKVTDDKGEPVPGVNIFELEHPGNGVISGIDGSYTITVSANDVILSYSFIGFVTQEIQVASRSSINITLVEDVTGLDEVVVVGFGTQKRANITGAASSVEMDKVLGNRPVTNTIQALQGTMPGVQITTNSGQPGATGLGINIRGTTSINGGSALILMDNVPVSSEDINPQDVESVTVLKDAAASSIYGARAAFGVILITTKKANKNESIKFNYSSTFSFSQPTDIPEKASTYDFVNALNDWGVTDFWTNQDVPTWVDFLEEYKTDQSLYPDGYAIDNNDVRYPLVDTDVIGEFLNDNGFSQIHNVNFSGGSEKTSYRVSAGYSDEDGIVVTENDRYKKYNVKAFLNTELTTNLFATIDLSYRNSKRKSPIGNYGRAISYGPYTPASGNHVFEDGTEVPYDSPANMERLKEAPQTLVDNLRMFGKMDYKPLKGLTLTGEYTFEKGNTDVITSDNQVLTVNPERYVLNGVSPEKTFYKKSNQQYTYEAINLYAKYEKSFSNHNLGILAGLNREERNAESFWVKKTNLISVDMPSISTATGTLTGDDSFGEWAVLGYFSRFNYNYKERYFLEANGRYDGSSKFPEKDRYGFFPSFSAGWNISKEAFMENVSFLSLLKIRGSWGEIGNQFVGNYVAIPGMPVYNTSWFNPSTGLRYNTMDVPDLVSSSFTWESVETLNLGIDIRALNNRLSTSFDWFTRKTIGMLKAGAELPAVLGADAPMQNAADLKSTGWELEMSWKDKINNFSYGIGFSLSDAQGEITKFDNEAGLLSQYYVGRKTGEIWGYVTDRYYTQDDFVEGTLNDNLMGGTLKEGIPAFKGRNPNPGDIKYKDLNGDGEIFSGNNTLEDPGDRKIIGNNTRRYQYGIFGNASYKNFDFSFLLNGIGKRDIYMNNSVRFPYTSEFQVVYSEQLDYWTPENTDAYFPRNYPLGGVNYGNSRSTQTKYMIDGSYLRIKNITFGYTLPQSLLDKVNIDRLRVYVSGENLHSFDNMPDGIDTELQNKGNGATYPLLKSFNVGLNLTF